MVTYQVFVIDTREYFVIKEIDTSNMTTEQAFEALEEISVQATIDSPFVVSIQPILNLLPKLVYNIVLIEDVSHQALTKPKYRCLIMTHSLRETTLILSWNIVGTVTYVATCLN